MNHKAQEPSTSNGETGNSEELVPKPVLTGESLRVIPGFAASELGDPTPERDCQSLPEPPSSPSHPRKARDSDNQLKLVPSLNDGAKLKVGLWLLSLLMVGSLLTVLYLSTRSSLGVTANSGGSRGPPVNTTTEPSLRASRAVTQALGVVGRELQTKFNNKYWDSEIIQVGDRSYNLYIENIANFTLLDEVEFIEDNYDMVGTCNVLMNDLRMKGKAKKVFPLRKIREIHELECLTETQQLEVVFIAPQDEESECELHRVTVLPGDELSCTRFVSWYFLSKTRNETLTEDLSNELDRILKTFVNYELKPPMEKQLKIAWAEHSYEAHHTTTEYEAHHTTTEYEDTTGYESDAEETLDSVPSDETEWEDDGFDE